MAAAFACPGCAVPIQLTAEMAGKRAKCPKCQIVFTVPAAQAPAARDGEARAKAALDDAFQDGERRDLGRKRSAVASRADDAEDERDEPRPQRKRVSRTNGATLPWILAIGGAALVLVIFCGGTLTVIGVVVFSGRKDRPAAPVAAVKNPVVAQPMPMPPPPGNNPVLNPPGANLPPGAPVRGIRVAQFNGALRIQSQLTAADAVFANGPGMQGFNNDNKRCKEYVIDLQANQTYVIDLESNQFDAYLRLEDLRGQLITFNDDAEPGRTLNARIAFRPVQTGTYVIVATSLGGGFGPFTLTVRGN